MTAHLINDPMYSYHAVSGPDVRLRISGDPLGPVNKIVTLLSGDRVIKSILYPVPAGVVVNLRYDAGSGLYREYFTGPGWRALNSLPEPESEPCRPPTYTVTVDGRRILEVPEHETWPPIPPPPPIPLWQRMRRAWAEQWRADVDRVMGRLGWHRDGACGGEDW